MEPVAIVSALALLQYFWFAFQVGGAHQRTGIKAPIMTGDPDLDRHVRVHMNTAESLIIFLPGLWLFGWYVHALIAAGIGLVFIVGRFLYARAYIKAPESRGLGFALSAGSFGILLLGGLIGAIVAWVGRL